MKNIGFTLIIILVVTFFVHSQNNLEPNLIYQRVMIPNGKISIEGLFVSSNAAQNKPAVIFLGGSGSWEIVEDYFIDPDKSYGSLLRFYIEEKFLSRGFSVLYLNKRGLGKSTGDWKKSDFNERASDAIAAFDFLKQYPGIDSTKIGMAGHSQGGWIAQIAAAKNVKVAFVLSFAGPTVGVYEQTRINDENSFLLCDGLSGKKHKRELRLRKLELSVGGKLGKLIGGEAGQWARIRNYENTRTLKNLKVPTLFLFAEYDTSVPPQNNIEHLNKVFNYKIPVHINYYLQEGIDHSFREVSGPCLDWTKTIENPYSKQLQQFIEAWLSQQI